MRRGVSIAAVVSAATVLLATDGRAPASPAATWERRAETPRGRRDHAACFHDATGRTLLFGGERDDGTLDGGTFLYDGYAWTRDAGSGPPARRDHAMAYDAARRTVVLFGGDDGRTPLADTWLFEGRSWSPGPPAPPGLRPRRSHGLAGDGRRARVVLFGGTDGQRMADAWEWDGTQWSAGAAAPGGLTPREGHAMAFHEGLGAVVIFGGSDGAPRNDTWLYDGSGFAAGPPAPPALVPRIDAAMAFDGAQGLLLVTGGWSPGAGKLGDTWVLRTGGWTAEGTAPAGPSARSRHTLAYDATRSRIVLFGGDDGSFRGDTWEHEGTTWAPAVGTPVGLGPRTGHAAAHDTGRNRTVLFGGETGPPTNVLLAETWELDGVAWSPGAPAPPGLSSRADHAMVYDEGRGRVVLFGGRGATGYLGDTWELDGVAWTPGPAAPPALTPREDHAMAYDAGRRLTVLHGGDDELMVNGDTWEYDGGAWSFRTSAGPGPKEGAAMTYDTRRGRVLLFGGDFVDARLWQYDGIAWTDTRPEGEAPPPRVRGVMAFDGTRDVAVLFGGIGRGDTWEYDGTRWMPGNGLSLRPSPRHSSAIAFDPLRGRVVLHGGRGAARALADTWEYGAPKASFVLGAGASLANPNRVRTFTASGVPGGADFHAYAAGQFGTEVGTGSIDADPADEILTGPGPGPGLPPEVRGFHGDGSPISTVDFFAYGTMQGGVHATAGAIDGGAIEQIVTGPGPGAVFGPHVRGFDVDGAGVRPLARVSFFAYGTLKYGTQPAAGDVDADSFEEILTAPGPGVPFSPHVRGFDVDAASAGSIAGINFDAFPLPGYGARVAGGDVQGDGRADVAAAPGPGGSAAYAAWVRTFAYDGTVAPIPGGDVVVSSSRYGGRVGLGDLGAGASADVAAGSGPDPAMDSTVRAYVLDDGALVAMPAPFEAMPGLRAGVNPSAGTLGR